MRHLLLGWLLAAFVTAVQAATPAPAAASAASSAEPALTPQQARQALAVLESPREREQVETTLRAIAAVGVLSAPAVPASAAAPASGASSAAAPAALTSNGLASMLVRQGSRWAVDIGNALRDSLRSLLEVGSVGRWWQDTLGRTDARTDLARSLGLIVAVLVPALVGEWLVRRLLRRALAGLAARRAGAPRDTASDDDARADDAAPPHDTPPPDASDATQSSRGRGHARRHTTLLHRMPRAIVSLLLRSVPLLVFVGIAGLMMSFVTDDGTPVEAALGALIDIYVIGRLVTIVSRLFFQPDAHQLRLLHISDAWAAFAQRSIARIVIVVGACTAAVEIAANLGLTEAGHVALQKAVALVAHVMISVLILQCRRPVAARIRAIAHDRPTLAAVCNALADAWAPVAVFVVMALWFVWALDVHNGYRVLIALGGRSIAVLIGMRMVSIVVFGALARLFHERDDDRTLVHLHAYRYYPLLRRIVSAVIAVVTVVLLLQVWGVPVFRAFESGTIGHRLASALVTIAIAAAVALVVWEAANIAIERRLQRWTREGNLVRAARLRTLLPMLRTLLFVMIALVVVLTGLSEIGVNVGPLLAGASIFGVALGFGSQKLVQDFITGIFLLMENAMQVGDWVTLAGVSGTVEYLSIRTVRLRGGDGSLYTIPFSSVTTVNNTNRGLGNAAVKVSIAYGEDIDRAVATLKEIGAALRDDPQYRDGILSDFSYWGVDQVDGAAIALAGQMQCRDSARWGVQREFNRRIAQLFRERGIRIADPQRSLVAYAAGSRREDEGDGGSGVGAARQRSDENGGDERAAPDCATGQPPVDSSTPAPKPAQ
ncbi:mechanosensitive ion channel domain-containing protein [Burkholderia multivorans]|uniref:mechanosensitive ion channel domain-containing protein n=1 Tax=Burkholderia multivorans TaxID=87883 RepID=UPI0002F0E1BE|nr:mechanosensitive ion channel domain-containing protein [Burkholderia multivorans]MBJ9654395.1 mechanosensitive ion channel [Burkholderia multivorans]MBR8045453.1 mechanosensitive ion channel [Burkholderia multivorans]MBU9472579.1 mechanosensitive ion channel [Burkholderia multivorans]MDR8876865.1 Moderate conductance mechanosensitive channel YbiO [Burkholderia multivorans]MDR8882779.1 Moderate conductance mechanosensitive channel YbiO [Burkholderia multivorans]